jgi:hypothetical protein
MPDNHWGNRQHHIGRLLLGSRIFQNVTAPMAEIIMI